MGYVGREFCKTVLLPEVGLIARLNSSYMSYMLQFLSPLTLTLNKIPGFQSSFGSKKNYNTGGKKCQFRRAETTKTLRLQSFLWNH
ncbi:hypothetical protein SAMN05443144_115104 [Fodinibius roseus]|uniref:Uncharacterized protein n=1 Tax=Fodinibius roseus TaxID=1194090 RepID=A0A1M5FQ38_9BACT|nr:hypothetical protein SAMN05443144_115104 [Fodinibius roseus]